MRVVVREPCDRLAPFVSTLWYFEGFDLPHLRERVLPTGTVQVLVNLHEDELRWYDGPGLERAHQVRGAVFCPAYPGAVGIDTAEQRRITGVDFRPAGASAFLDPPLSAFGGEHVDVADVWHDEPVRERLLEVATPEAVLDTWERVLLERLRSTVDPRIAHAVEALESGRPVATVAEVVNMSGKRFRRRFEHEVGLKPKRYARIRRLQRTVRQILATPDAPWAQIAFDCGYHDQAHMVHEFQALAGCPPTAYRPRNETDYNHLPLE